MPGDPNIEELPEDNKDADQQVAENKHIYDVVDPNKAGHIQKNQQVLDQNQTKIQQGLSAYQDVSALGDAQTGSNNAADVDSDYGDLELVPGGDASDRTSTVLASNEPVRLNNNTRRYLALVGVSVAGTTLFAGIGALIYALLKAKANDEPIPPGLPPDVKDSIWKQIDTWEKATVSDADFWEKFALFVTDPTLDPPLMLVENISFCSYVMDHNPIKGDPFLFNDADDSTSFIMQLVATYTAQLAAGKKLPDGAAAMYRQVYTFGYSADSGTPKPFPRQVQAMLLRAAFSVIVYPTPGVEMMKLADQWKGLADTVYWKQFTDYMAAAKPPLTIHDQISFCSYTVSVAPPDGFTFSRQEIEDALVSQLASQYSATSGFVGIYTLAPTLTQTGQPGGAALSLRRQASLIRSALSQIETRDGESLFDLVVKWQPKSDDDYWSAFVQYLGQMKTKNTPLTISEQIEFCTYTVQQSLVPNGYVSISDTDRASYVQRLKDQYALNSLTDEVYPLLSHLPDRPPALPRAIQARLMRLFLVQIGL